MQLSTHQQACLEAMGVELWRLRPAVGSNSEPSPGVSVTPVSPGDDLAGRSVLKSVPVAGHDCGLTVILDWREQMGPQGSLSNAAAELFYAMPGCTRSPTRAPRHRKAMLKNSVPCSVDHGTRRAHRVTIQFLRYSPPQTGARTAW